MSENERVMMSDFNPYDQLIEPAAEPVKSPVILGNSMEPENINRMDGSMEIIPLAAGASYSKLQVKENKITDVVLMEVEEDILVPDTFPDMETILNMDVSVDTVDTYNENGNAEIKGKLKVETMYRSAEHYGDNISVVPAGIDFSKHLKPEGAGQPAVKIEKVEYRIINERKYKAKIHAAIYLKKENEKEYMIFDGIENEKLYLRKEDVTVIDMVSRKTKSSDINEELLIGDEKIRPVKILKSKIIASENHRQLTSEKLVLNRTLWVRILYLAEIASKGNLSNQPMLYQGKIDHTQFIPLGKGEGEVVTCTTCTPEEKIDIEINRESNGFMVSGEIITDVEFYSEVKKEIVTDFYHDKEEMTCDMKSEKVCVSVNRLSVEQTLRESISLQAEAGDELRIIYVDAQVVDTAVTIEGSSVMIRGKLHLEAVIMNEGDYTMLAKKICDFSCVKELHQGTCSRTDLERVIVREIKGDISGGEVNLTAQLQVDLNIYNEAEIACISNPCIIRRGQPAKQYPITIHTVADGETIWEIGKKYKVGEDCITAYNKPECIQPGKKIIIVK